MNVSTSSPSSQAQYFSFCLARAGGLHPSSHARNLLNLWAEEPGKLADGLEKPAFCTQRVDKQEKLALVLHN